MDSSNPITPRSVRVKKSPRTNTNLELPNNSNNNQQQQTIESTLNSSQDPSSTAVPPLHSEESTSMSRATGSIGTSSGIKSRKRKGTITERLFSNEIYTSLEDGTGGEGGDRGRSRSTSVVSSRDSVRAVPPVQVVIKGGGRRSSIIGGGRRGSVSLDDQLHAEDEVNLVRSFSSQLSNVGADIIDCE